MSGSLDGKLALITGASRGIGAAVAEAFAAAGADLILVARDAAALDEVATRARLSGRRVEVAAADIRDEAKMRDVAARIRDDRGVLDILVANAAILGPREPIETIEPEVWRDVLDVNVVANAILIRAFGLLLTAAPAGRAIFVSSGVVRGVANAGPYAASKAALEALVKSWAHEIAQTRARANIIYPGVVRTQMRAAFAPEEDPQTLPEPIAIAPLFLEMASESFTDNGALRNVRDHLPLSR